jgi:hypothetical protein
MTLSTALTLLIWWGAGFMTGGAIMIVLGLVIAAVAGSFGWMVEPFE